MATVLVGYDTESAAVGEGLARFLGPDFPQYARALDAETIGRALEVMTAVHAEVGVPATLFLCGRTLVHGLDAVRAACETGLFDVQQHTYSHVVFRDVDYTPSEGTTATIRASPPWALEAELRFTSELIQRHLDIGVVGLRTPFGYYRGLRDRPDLLAILDRCGIRYVSSWIRNESGGNPTPFVQPFAYAEEGFPGIVELPAQFWIDGIWFDAHGWENGAGYRVALEQVVDEIVERDLVFGACFHEWAVLSADEERTGWIRGFLSHAVERGVEVTTYTEYWRRLAANGPG